MPTAEASEHGGTICANCETPLSGPFCHQCGQRGHLHNRLRDLAHEFVEGIAHFDGRLWRTLPVLALNPGKLSRDWMAGKRVRYVAPLHVFLFAFFLFFTVPQLMGVQLNFITAVNGVETPKTAKEREAFFKKQQQSITDARAKNAEARKAREAETGEKLGESNLDKFMAEMEKKAGHMDYYSYKFQVLAYKLSFLLGPFSMGILALLFWFKRGVTLYDHGVVALYGLGFAALLAPVGILFTGLVGGLIELAIMIILPIHAVRHIKVAYALSWPVAIGTGLIMGALTMLAGLLFFLGVIALGFFG